MSPSPASATHLYVGGLRVQIAGQHPALSSWLDDLHAFQQPQPFLQAVRLDVTVGGEIPSGASGSITYERADLVFGMDAERRQATVWVDGCLGGFEAALQLVLQAALLPVGGLIVHASAGVFEGESWLFPGRSGDGKSTAARAGGFDEVLSDEMVVLRPSPSGYMAYGTPFWSEGRTLPYSTACAPLGVLAQLVKSPQVGADSLHAADAIAHLLRCVTLYERSEQARRWAFEAACAVVQSTRSIALRFPKEGPWVSAAKSHI